MCLINRLNFNKKNIYIGVLILIMFLSKVNAEPFPTPKPEGIIKCFGFSNETICGNHGKCEYHIIKDNDKEVNIRMCVCNDQYGTLSFDKKPCTRKRVTQSTVFWLQLFLGWIQVGAFILHWWWYASSVFIVIGIFCCCTCSCLCYDSSNKETSKSLDSCNSCLSCICIIVILVMWIVNVVYIITNCFSVIEITSGSNMGEHSLKCWNDM